MNVEIHVFGKENSVKETHQGFLSRSIPARRRRSLRGRLRTKKEDTQMRVFLFGAGGRTRTGTPSLAVDFESTTSTNSITPAHGLRWYVEIIIHPI